MPNKENKRKMKYFDELLGTIFTIMFIALYAFIVFVMFSTGLPLSIAIPITVVFGGAAIFFLFLVLKYFVQKIKQKWLKKE